MDPRETDPRETDLNESDLRLSSRPQGGGPAGGGPAGGEAPAEPGAEPRATDDSLREVFRRNAPPANEQHLAAALRPGTWIEPGGSGRRARKRRAPRPRLRLALVVTGAVVLAAAIGVGSWQAVGHLGSGRVMVITDRTTEPSGLSTVSSDPTPALSMVDGDWVFRADRQLSSQSMMATPSADERLPESAYRPLTERHEIYVLISGDGETVEVDQDLTGQMTAITGRRTATTDGSIRFDLDTFAGGRLLIWQGDDGFEAEFTEYGSGVPIVASYRGAFVPVVGSNTGTSSSTSVTSSDVQTQLKDGSWELRADRRGLHFDDVRFPSDDLAESAYVNIDGSRTFSATISDGGARVSVKGDEQSEGVSAGGTRTTIAPDKIRYDLDLMAGGRLVVWQTDDGLQAEFTQYGSGVPIVSSYRGRFVKIPDDQEFADAWKASVAAVNKLGPTRIAVTQTMTVTALGSGGTLSAEKLGTFVWAAEELLDPAKKRAHLAYTAPDGSRYERTVDGRDEMIVNIASMAASSKSPASRFVSEASPSGLAIPLVAGARDTAVDDYAYLSDIGRPSDQQVERGAGDTGTYLTWQREWTGDDTTGSDTVKLTLGADGLPVRIDITGVGTISETRVERVTSIEYQIEKDAVFQDSEFSVDLPAYAYLSFWGQRESSEHPATDDKWGQYWLGLSVGDWSLKTGRIDIVPDVFSPDKESASFTYERLYPAYDLAGFHLTFDMKVTPRTAKAADAARQLGEQQAGLRNWSRSEATIAGQKATVYTKPAAGADAAHPGSLYVFLPDAFITIDLGGLVEAQQVLAAITRLEAGMGFADEPTTTPSQQ